MKIEGIKKQDDVLGVVDDSLVLNLIKYLENNDLLRKVYSNLYYKSYKSAPVYEINYYKHKVSGRLMSLYEVRNSFEVLKDLLESHKVYAYDYIRVLMFMKQEVGREVIRREEYCKSYHENKDETIYPISLNQDIFKLFKTNPLLFASCVNYFGIDINELNDIEEHTYKKEIKK